MYKTSALLFALSLGLVAAKASVDWKPSGDQVNYLEKKLVLPDDAPGPLARYERFYSGVYDDNKKLIHGELIYLPIYSHGQGGAADKGQVHVILEADMPAVSNGGCGVVGFYYKPGSDNAPSMYCNAPDPTDTP